MKKLFFVDVETSGLDPKIHDILTLSYIVDIDGIIKESGTFKIAPEHPDTIDPGAFEVNHLNLVEILAFDKADIVHARLLARLNKYVDMYAPNDTFYLVAYNAPFDSEFLRQFWERRHDGFFGSWFNKQLLDPLPLLRYLDYRDVLSLPDYKLTTVTRHFGIEQENAHTSMADVIALRTVFYRMKPLLLWLGGIHE